MALRVCYVITAMGYGGAERLLVNSCNKLVEQGYTIHIIYLKPINDLIPDLDQRITSRLIPYKSIFSFGKKLRAEINAFNPDVVHTHLGHADLLGLFALRKQKLKKFCTLHNVYYKWNFVDNIIFFAYRWLFRILSQPVNVIGISSAVAQHAIDTYGVEPSYVFFVPNSIPENPSPQSSQVDEHSFLKPNNHSILFIGRLRVQKSVDTLINAAKILRDKLDNFNIYIVGEGELEENLKDLSISLSVDDCVHFVGTTNHVHFYLSQCDVLVLPSVFEGLPTVVLEAFRAKTPVIASNIDGSTDLVKEGVSGFLFNVGSPDDLAEKILKFYSMENKNELSTNAYNSFIENYTIDKYVNQHIRLYNS